MAFIKTKKGWEIPEREATPESAYMDRRQFLKALGISTMSASQLLTACSYDRSFESFDGSPISDPSSTPADILALYPATRNAGFSMLDRDLTRADVAGSYNNFYEFSSGKTGIGELAQRLSLTPWSVEITGLVHNPMTLDVNDIQRRFPLEERLYRHRCVEAWSMAVPWTGFPLKALIDIVQPDSTARYVEMTTFINPEVAPGQFNNPQWPWPYRESITVEEAANDLALIATGIYGRTLPSQHGAPIRLVIPWKYGFKSIKSIVKIEFVAERPTTFWNSLYPAAYGFTANVNPDVPHPNWPQNSEFMIGTNEIRATLPYNGYGDFVSHLYPAGPG